jgi:hypothetical protein
VLVGGGATWPPALPSLAPQVKYVVELAKTMALHPAVHRVDLLTRLIRCGLLCGLLHPNELPLTCGVLVCQRLPASP